MLTQSIFVHLHRIEWGFTGSIDEQFDITKYFKSYFGIKVILFVSF